MKVIRKKVFSIILCILLVFMLIGCDDSTSQVIEDINNEVKSYDEVDISEIPNPDENFDTYNDLSDMSDFDSDEFIETNVGNMMLIMLQGLTSISNVTESYYNGYGSFSNSKDMDMGLVLHIDDEEMYYTEEDDDEYIYSMNIDWFDLVMSGSTATSIADILNDGVDAMDKDVSLNLSAYFILGINGSYDYIPYSIKFNIEIDQENVDDILLSSALDLSYATRVIFNSYIGVMGFKLDLADIEGLTAEDIEEIFDIINSIDDESDLDQLWLDIEEIIWDNTDDTHISLEINVGDSTGLLGSMVYEDEDFLSLYFAPLIDD